MNKFNQKTYAAINKDYETRMKSSSGGIFSLLAETIIKKGGVVFGASYDNEFNVVHTYIDNISELHRFRGSKYVLSNMGNSYAKVKSFLEEGRIVLFTGTPCQIAGLNCFLGKSYDNLYMQDLVCHGVPMQNIWKKYLDYRKKLDGATPKDILFRDKANGWSKFEMKFLYEDSSYSAFHGDDLFMKLFLKNYSLRESCYACKFKGLNRIADITLADFWGIKHVCEEMYDGKGTSLVMINSEKGKELFDLFEEKVEKKEVDIQKAIEHNICIVESVSKPEDREEFLSDVDKLEMNELVKKYIENK